MIHVDGCESVEEGGLYGFNGQTVSDRWTFHLRDLNPLNKCNKRVSIGKLAMLMGGCCCGSNCNLLLLLEEALNKCRDN